MADRYLINKLYEKTEDGTLGPVRVLGTDFNQVIDETTGTSLAQFFSNYQQFMQEAYFVYRNTELSTEVPANNKVAIWIDVSRTNQDDIHSQVTLNSIILSLETPEGVIDIEGGEEIHLDQGEYGFEVNGVYTNAEGEEFTLPLDSSLVTIDVAEGNLPLEIKDNKIIVGEAPEEDSNSDINLSYKEEKEYTVAFKIFSSPEIVNTAVRLYLDGTWVEDLDDGKTIILAPGDYTCMFLRNDVEFPVATLTSSNEEIVKVSGTGFSVESRFHSLSATITITDDKGNTVEVTVENEPLADYIDHLRFTIPGADRQKASTWDYYSVNDLIADNEHTSILEPFTGSPFYLVEAVWASGKTEDVTEETEINFDSRYVYKDTDHLLAINDGAANTYVQASMEYQGVSYPGFSMKPQKRPADINEAATIFDLDFLGLAFTRGRDWYGIPIFVYTDSNKDKVFKVPENGYEIHLYCELISKDTQEHYVTYKRMEHPSDLGEAIGDVSFNLGYGELTIRGDVGQTGTFNAEIPFSTLPWTSETTLPMSLNIEIIAGTPALPDGDHDLVAVNVSSNILDYPVPMGGFGETYDLSYEGDINNIFPDVYYPIVLIGDNGFGERKGYSGEEIVITPMDDTIQVNGSSICVPSSSSKDYSCVTISYGTFSGIFKFGKRESYDIQGFAYLCGYDGYQRTRPYWYGGNTYTVDPGKYPLWMYWDTTEGYKMRQKIDIDDMSTAGSGIYVDQENINGEEVFVCTVTPGANGGLMKGNNIPPSLPREISVAPDPSPFSEIPDQSFEIVLKSS